MQTQPPPAFHLRPARAEDSLAIRDLVHRTGINPLGLDWRRFVIASTDAEPFIGCAQLKPHPDGSLELASLAVTAAFRHQGVARSLIAHCLAQAPHPLYLTCRPALVPFYQKFGFQPATPAALPPYFRRLLRLVHTLAPLIGHHSPAVMILP